MAEKTTSSFNSVDDLFAFADGLTNDNQVADNDIDNQDDIKQVDDNIVNVDTENNTNEGIEKTDETIIENDGEENQKATDESEPSTEDNKNEKLVNLGLDQESNVKELHDAWKKGEVKLEMFEAKKPLINVVERSGIKDMDLVALALEAASGNKDAMAKLIAINDIEPIDLIPDNGEEIDKNMSIDLSKYKEDDEDSVDDLNFNEAIIHAEAHGVKDVFVTQISTWGEQAIKDIVSNKGNVEKITEQMSNGRFDEIMTEVGRLKDSDYSSKYKNEDGLGMYIIAENNLAKEQNNVKDTTEEVKSDEKSNSSNGVEETDNDVKRLEEALKASIQAESSNPGNSTTSNRQETAEERLNKVFAYADTLR